MLYSYAMGVDSSIYELKKQGFKIEEDSGNFMVAFPENKRHIWEDFIKSSLNVEFWNEYISKETKEAVFNFHFKDGFKRYVVTNLEDDYVLSLCEKLCNYKFGSIEKMLRDNHFYNRNIFNQN